MKKIYLFTLFMLSLSLIYAQTEISNFNATGAGYSTSSLTDYQCLGINPANLGWTWNEHSWNLGLLEAAISIYSEPLTKKQVMHDLFKESIELSYNEKQKAADDFTNARIWASGAVTWFGISYQQEKIGGFAFSIRDRGLWNSVLNDQAALFLFQGYNAPYFDVHIGDTGYSSKPQPASVVYKGTDLDFIWYREYNLGYGRKIIDEKDFLWYGGIGLKYLVGYGSAQYLQDDEGKLVAYSSLSPIFKVDYGKNAINPVTGKGLKKVGTGFGFDIGTTFKYKDLKVGLALNDIGSIKWTGNVFEGYNALADSVYLIETDGIDNYNIFAQGQLIVTDDASKSSQWQALDKKKVKIPMNLKSGASYKFSEKIEAGFDLYVPLGKPVPGRFESPIFGIGGKFTPVDWVQLNIGIVSGGKLGTNIPFGISLFPIKDDEKTWQIGVATRDMLTLFQKTDPTLSIAFGFLRFSFGHKETATRYLEK
ncbi:MAG: DUF5723 family protein [Bacteroidetes bacterium]|nr:DUF5723 family protein [Bacteroidota bacterium]